MNERVALCIDEPTRDNPDLIGLDGEDLGSQQWLSVFVDAESARREIRASESVREAWVISNCSIEPINLAATLKADDSSLAVRLVEADCGGSVLSRAHTAAIDEVISPAAFVRLYSEAKQQGFSVETVGRLGDAGLHEVSPAVGDPVQLQPQQRCEPASCTRAVRSGRAFLMPVVSGSGGAGKSTVAVLSACMTARRGLRTLLMDCDLQFGDVALALGRNDALALDEALAKPDALERIYRSEGLVVLAAPAHLETAERVSGRIGQILDAVSDSFDVIIANTGSSWGEHHAVLLERCSAALFLVDQRSSSLRACKHALELCMRCGIATGPFQFALNRAGKGALLNAMDVSCMLQGKPVFELKDGGRDVEELIGSGGAADLASSRNDLCSSLQHILDTMLPQAPGGASVALDAPSNFPERRMRRRGRHSLRRMRGAQ